MDVTFAKNYASYCNFFGAGNKIEEANSIEDALEQAKLNFTVSQHDLIVIGRQGNFKIDFKIDDEEKNIIRLSKDSEYHGLTFPKLSPIVRDDTKEVIAIMGSNYKIIQNIECVKIMDDIIKESIQNNEPLEIFRGGAINQCSLLFLAAKLPRMMEIVDINSKKISLHQYLIIQWSHTGEGKLSLSFVAYNPQNHSILYNNDNTLNISIRHTKNAGIKINKANFYLKKCYQSFLRFESQIKFLAEKPMTKNSLEKFLKYVFFPEPKNTEINKSVKKITLTKIENKRERILSRFEEINGGTFFDAYNATCKYQDFDVTTKQKTINVKRNLIKEKSDLKLLSSLKGNGAKLKKRAFESLLSWE